MKLNKISFIIPIYNEEECLNELIKRILIVKKKLYAQKKISLSLIFIDDASTDNSFLILNKYANKFKFIKIIKFTRNFGHQIAISAGIKNCKDDAAIIIDGDLQDPPELIFKFIKKFLEGYDVVYAKRKQRKGESFFKIYTAKLFYIVINKLTGFDIPLDTGDFRMISKKIINNLNLLEEKHRFIRGLIPWLGFNSSFIEYERDKRFAGKTKFSFKSMTQLAFNAILSFSVKPIVLIIKFSLICIIFSFIFGLYIIYTKLFTDTLLPGFATITSLIVFLFGFNLFFLGTLGYYISLIFEQSKDRPLFIVDKKINI